MKQSTIWGYEGRTKAFQAHQHKTPELNNYHPMRHMASALEHAMYSLEIGIWKSWELTWNLNMII